MSVVVASAACEVEELHEISVTHRPETGRCRCMDCGGCTEQVTGHHEVASMRARATQHAMVTGHRVLEHSEADSMVGPRGGRGVLHAI